MFSRKLEVPFVFYINLILLLIKKHIFIYYKVDTLKLCLCVVFNGTMYLIAYIVIKIKF